MATCKDCAYYQPLMAFCNEWMREHIPPSSPACGRFVPLYGSNNADKPQGERIILHREITPAPRREMQRLPVVTETDQTPKRKAAASPSPRAASPSPRAADRSRKDKRREPRVDVEAIRRLLEQGKTRQQIADELGIHKSTVSRWAKELGFQSNRALSGERQEKVLRLLIGEGLSQVEIAGRLGMPYQTVLYYIQTALEKGLIRRVSHGCYEWTDGSTPTKKRFIHRDEVLQLVLNEKMTVREAAVQLRISEKTVRYHLNRAIVDGLIVHVGPNRWEWVMRKQDEGPASAIPPIPPEILRSMIRQLERLTSRAEKLMRTLEQIAEKGMAS